ncbi:hypothetical protein DT73_17200 [Mangrovibacter sp. MFB070]|uniref:tail fiber assembly protein n=1 Tax=Mangrovibacter sp. MFB070 TaxID=1224318 RepID=UPI0004D5B20E|nr:tail fiber assembly protein [Mangrovibacter sp. MFB070]KEA51451.1 hypothetical protein DT73_17200 [Mangrovibacter sp. MFB070]
MEILNVKNPQFTAAGGIDCEVLTSMGWLPFTAVEDDCESHGRELYHELLAGTWGDVAEYIPPVITAEKLTAQAEATKQRLMLAAEGQIAPLSRAVKFGMATAEEVSQLEAWERYTVLLNRVDCTNPEWPELP